MLLDANATLPVGTAGSRFAPADTAANDNTPLFSAFLRDSGMVAVNCHFQRPSQDLVTFRGPNGRQACLDYVVVRQPRCTSVLDTRVFDTPTVCSDHRLVRATLRL
eukprot:7539087-Lingulodinium_polyedra.AAC.1